MESKWSYFKCDHDNQNFVVNRVSGYLQQKVVHFIMNLSTTQKTFYLSRCVQRQNRTSEATSRYICEPFVFNIHLLASARRHGQSEYNAIGRIGGDSGLSPHGVAYARALAVFVENKICRNESGADVPARLWTSTLRRTKETGQFIKQNKLILKDEEEGVDYEWIQMRPRAWHHLDELFAGTTCASLSLSLSL